MRTDKPATPEIGVGGIVFNREGEVLLIRRGKSPALGLWSIPGGKLEPGETIVQACRREFLEETGLDVEVGSLVAVAERILEGFHYVILDFVVTLTHPDDCFPQAASDASQISWVAYDKLAEYPLVEGLQGIIEQVSANLRHGIVRGLIDPSGQGRDFFQFQ
ncbi:MAG: NUDIX hydrolase [Pseudomonadota bacterium]